MVKDFADPRRLDPPLVADERSLLEAWLEFHRSTLLLKCEGLDELALATRPVATSSLSLHGLIRHMTEVERSWFTRCLLRAPQTPHVFRDPAVPDAEFVPAASDDWPRDLAGWQAECGRSRAAAARYSLDETGLRQGQEYSLRWIYLHMIEEYARHNGHADLIREMIVGVVGW
jgi:uncharacterized damage-inducible protein DinB